MKFNIKFLRSSYYWNQKKSSEISRIFVLNVCESLNFDNIGLSYITVQLLTIDDDVLFLLYNKALIYILPFFKLILYYINYVNGWVSPPGNQDFPDRPSSVLYIESPLISAPVLNCTNISLYVILIKNC